MWSPRPLWPTFPAKLRGVSHKACFRHSPYALPKPVICLPPSKTKHLETLLASWPDRRTEYKIRTILGPMEGEGIKIGYKCGECHRREEPDFLRAGAPVSRAGAQSSRGGVLPSLSYPGVERERHCSPHFPSSSPIKSRPQDSG